MTSNKIWNKPLHLRWLQGLWGALDRWSLSSGWPLTAIALRVFMLPLFPLYLWRLGPAQGLVTYYRFFMGAEDFTIYRTERDNGTMIRQETTDPWVFQQIFILQEYRPIAARPNVRVIIDAGAYVGYSSIYFAELYPHAFIYALEPEENNFQALQRNTRHYPNINPIQAALWKEDGFIEMATQSVGEWAYHVRETRASNKQRIPAITVQTLLDQYRLPCIDILKMDIEGAEAEVFAGPGCHSWLPAVRLLVVELHDHLYPESDRSFREAIQRYDFIMRTSGENLIFELPGPVKVPALVNPKRRFS